MPERYLIVGLGNPGKEYELTRHNAGFMVVKDLAKGLNATFRPALSTVKGSLAKGEFEGNQLLLLLPLTYMNESGNAARRAMEYYDIPLENVLVVCDDIALPLGTLRLREKGSAGGHNGLKSIEAHLSTQEYKRLRFGVGQPQESGLRDFVLERFSKEEQEKLPTPIERATAAIKIWIKDGIEAAMRAANEQLGETGNA
jgi:PTH1 family peptidyl-tRNA hydrolase